MSYDPNHWDESQPANDDCDELDSIRNAEAIEGQTSMFPPKKNFLFRKQDEINNINIFNDIIYKNPSYTAWELLDLHEQAESMADMCDEDA